ncbi:hypothetical protein QWY93_00870 [Echinicola jeungdonensis]|uniref:Uncharacterized protein n=1 Tax=Echinicola jeungdonensis TaxID=709343 RepID=A0ABV5J629_9BACT|nr:hypothetical protein [Echinicola jeungdonensis]MDN3667892.1 hypothetical protein [Echinicola jeungdonensis]
MSLDKFQKSIKSDKKPSDDLSVPLQSLWWDGKGDWDKAHDLVNEKSDTASAHVHAYLHRKEGDLSNASFWYRRAGKPISELDLEKEWEQLVVELLENGS